MSMDTLQISRGSRTNGPKPYGSSLKKRLPILLVLAGVAVGLYLTLALLLSTDGYPLDDAWIHLDYAASLTERLTFGHTPGGWENGATAPLWSILIAIPLGLGIPAGLAAKIVGFASLGLLLIAVYRVANRLGGLLAAAVTTLIIVFDPWVGILTASGMEPIGAMTASLFLIDGLLRRRSLQAGIALAAAGLLRPELSLLVPLSAASLALAGRETHERREPMRRVRQWSRLLLPPLLAGGGWMVYGMAVTGSPLPNSFWIKTTSHVDLPRQIEALDALFLSGPLYSGILVVGLAALGLVRLGTTRPRYLPILFLPPVTLILFYLFRLPLGGNYGFLSPGSAENVYFARYPLLVIPWLALWIGLGSGSIFRFVVMAPARFLTRTGATAVGIGCMALLAVSTIPSWQADRASLAEAYRANCAEIDEVEIGMARWIETDLPFDAVVGVSDAGALRFFTDCRIIDLVGLNTHEMFRTDDPVRWLEQQRLSHLVIWPHWHRRLRGDRRLTVREIASHHIDRPTIVPARDLVVYEVSFPR